MTVVLDIGPMALDENGIKDFLWTLCGDARKLSGGWKRNFLASAFRAATTLHTVTTAERLIFRGASRPVQIARLEDQAGEGETPT